MLEPIRFSRDSDFIVHDLSAEASQLLAGTFTPPSARIAIDVDAAFSMLGMSRGALFLYVGQPDEPGAVLYDCGGKPLPGLSECHSVASVNGESAWAGTTHRRLFFDVDPTKPVTFQVLAAIIGGAATVPLPPHPTRMAIAPDGTRAFVVSPDAGCVTPITLGRPGHSYRQDLNPMDEPHPPVATGASPLDVACDDTHVVVCDEAGVTILDASTVEVVHKVDVPGAAAVAITPHGALVATDTGHAVLIDAVAGAVMASTDLGGPLAGAAPSGYVGIPSHGAVVQLKLPDLSVVRKVDVGAEPVVIRTAQDGTTWAACKPNKLVGIDVGAYELPYENPTDLAFVPVASQTTEIVRTAWVTYEDSMFSQFQISGVFAGQTHTYHNGLMDGGGDTTGVAVNDYGEIWVVQSALDRIWKWPGGRLFIRPGLFFGEYCEVSVYPAS